MEVPEVKNFIDPAHDRFYNWSMARGWESKSVESQIESAEKRPAGTQPQKSGTSENDQNKKNDTRERQGLLLSRAYVLHQIESSSNDRYIESLRKALADLNQKLAQLDGH